MSARKKHRCGECRYCLWEEDAGYWCIKCKKRIWAINLFLDNLFCNHFKKIRMMELEKKYTIQNECRTLAQVHIVLGMPLDQRYYEQRLKHKKTKGNVTVYRHLDGSYKSKKECLDELRELFNEAIKTYHPDVNPASERYYYDEESKKIIAAYNRGKEIIERRYSI